MVTPIDAVRYGMGFDEAGCWHEASPRFTPARRKFGDEDPLAPARGIVYGALASALLWVGIAAAARALFSIL